MRSGIVDGQRVPGCGKNGGNGMRGDETMSERRHAGEQEWGYRPLRAEVEIADHRALRAALKEEQEARWDALAEYLRHLPVITRDQFELATCLMHDINALIERGQALRQT